MKIRYISDIHLDWDENWLPAPCLDDKETTLIIAGDLWKDSKHLTKIIPSLNSTWMEAVASRFKYVVYVLGNHDYWNARLDTLVEKNIVLAETLNLDNVFLLENNSIMLEGIIFVGGTLWTDYGRRSPLSMMNAERFMNDYRLTRIGEEYRKMKPTDCLYIFDKTKKTIFDTAKQCKETNTPCVVITHMAPSYNSVHERYRNSLDEESNTWYSHRESNTWYYSDLDSYIYDSDVKYWFHGHMHHTHDYVVGNTRVMCNPKGYVGESGTGFEECAHVNI